MEYFFEGIAPKYINPNSKTVTNKDLTIWDKLPKPSRNDSF